MWTVDFGKQVAIHRPTGAVLHFVESDDAPGALDGRIINPEVLGKMNTVTLNTKAGSNK